MSIDVCLKAREQHYCLIVAFPYSVVTWKTTKTFRCFYPVTVPLQVYALKPDNNLIFFFFKLIRALSTNHCSVLRLQSRKICRPSNVYMHLCTCTLYMYTYIYIHTKACISYTRRHIMGKPCHKLSKKRCF